MSDLFLQIKRLKANTKPLKKNKKAHEAEQLKRIVSEAQLLKMNVEEYQNQEEKIKMKKTGDGIWSQDCVGEDKEKERVYGFEGVRFCFPVKDVELSEKRIQIFTNIIIKRGGTVINLQEAKIKGVDYLVLSSSSWRKQKPTDYSKIKSKKALDYHYIIECQKQKRVLPPAAYQLVSHDQSHLQQEKETRKRRHIEEDQTDCQFQKQQQQKQKQSVTQSSTQELSIEKKTQSLYKISSTSTVRKLNEPNKQLFACQKGSSLSEFPVNQYIYEELMKFCNIYENQKDTGRKIAYLKAASAIKSFHKEIQSERDIFQLRGVGKKIIDKVRELLETGRIQKLQKLQQSQQTLICQELTRVWGIGALTAKQLYAKGIHSIEMLRQRQDLLNKNQRIGLKYLQEFQQRIPRQKVQKMFDLVKEKLFQLAGSDQLHQIEACGSFRRGKQTCGDMDIIITRKDGTYQQNLLIDLITSLEQCSFLTDHLSIPSHKPPGSSLSYMGVCYHHSGPLHHRIDIKYYPVYQYPYAILYFTGSDMFNRSMRLFARKKGYSLSDHGLMPVERGGGNGVLWKGGVVSVGNEEEIFGVLGLEYKEPWERNV